MRREVWLLLATGWIAGCSGGGGGSGDASAGDVPGDDVPGNADQAVPVDDRGAPAEHPALDGPISETAVPPPGDAPADLRPPASGAPLPGGVLAPRRLLEGAARLTGQGWSSCSHQPPAPGQPAPERWCSVMKPGATPGSTELWVLNLDQAVTVGVPACDGSSPACRRLTTNLWASNAVLGGPVHPYSHEFHGDTLIFYADALSGKDEVYRGPVYAWRPGWAEARRISSPRAVICWGHPEQALAHCLNDFVGPAMRPESVQLGAGPIADIANNVLAPLPFMRTSRPGSIIAWEAGFSPRGDTFVLSSPDPDPLVEAVRVIPTSQLQGTGAMPVEILRDATSWSMSRTGKKIFFYRPEPAAGSEGKSLYAADFPSGANVIKLVTGIRDYLLLGDDTRDVGVAYLLGVGGFRSALRLLTDLGNPASAVTIFEYEGELEGIALSLDDRFTAWSDSRFNLRVVRHGDQVSCDLNTTARKDAFAPTFLKSAGLVFWKEDSDEGPDRLDGYLANPDGCTGKRRFGLAVDFTIPIGDRAVVFGDELDSDRGLVTLKYVPIAGGKEWPATEPFRIHDRVDNSSVIVLSEDPLLLLFRVLGATPADAETFVFGPVP
jgi:hypothetical protein